MEKIINLPGQLSFRVVSGQQVVEMSSPFGGRTISRNECAAIIKGLRFARRQTAGFIYTCNGSPRGCERERFGQCRWHEEREVAARLRIVHA